jgi:threonine dehydrogenase-like Zn-dependent dehydrogenase
MSEYVKTEEKSCCPLPDQLTFEDAAFLACSAGTAYASLKKLARGTGDGYLAVVGLGPIGTVASLVAHAKGWKTIGIDVSGPRVEYCRKQGIEAFCPEPGRPLEEQLKGRMKGKLPARVYDTTGNADGLADAFLIAGRGAHIVTIGKGPRPYTMSERINMGDLILKQITFMTSWVFTLPDYHELVEFMLDAGLSFSQLVTGRFRFEEAQQAFERAANPETVGKTVFVK